MDVAVLILEGKGAAYADTAKVRIFSDMQDANEFCERVTHGGKYWVYAQTMVDGEQTDTYKPDWIDDVP